MTRAPLKNSRFLQAAFRKPVDKTPIWLMRQAGRYLPEYRTLRAQAGDFLTLCKTPELACEITLQPLARFDLDAAIIFSDILTIPDAMGLGLYFEENHGPRFKHPLTDIHSIKKLGIPDPEADLRYVMDAIRLTQRTLNSRIPLIGFSGSPWTLATYMVEGGKSHDSFFTIKNLLKQEPKTVEHLLSVLTDAVIEYLNAQIAAGVNAIMLFDTWGSILDNYDFARFSLEYIKIIINKVTKRYDGQDIPILVFSRNANERLDAIAESGCQVVSLDETINLEHARLKIGHKVALQGNLDPKLLFSEPANIEKHIDRILKEFGPHLGHIFNLGHGVLPQTPPEHVAFLIDKVHEKSVEYHS